MPSTARTGSTLTTPIQREIVRSRSAIQATAPAAGLDNAEITRRLVLAPKTVRNLVSEVLTKLRARSRAEAVALARDAGLGGVDRH